MNQRVKHWMVGLGLLLGMVMPWLAHGAQLRVAVSVSPMSLPVFAAAQWGLFTKHGVDPTISTCKGGFKCLAEMQAGRADLATSSELPVLFSAFERQDFGVIATFAGNQEDLHVLIRKDLQAKGLAGLAGRKVGVVRRTAAHYYMDLVALALGHNPRGMQYVHYNPEDMANAFAKGEIDAMVLWEPFAQLTLRQHADTLVALPVPRMYTQFFNLSATHQAMRNRGDELQAVLRAIHEACVQISNRPEEAKDLMVKFTGLDRSFVDRIWRNFQFRLSLQQSLLTTMEGQARWAIREGHVHAQATPLLARWIEPQFLQGVSRSSVDFAFRTQP